MLTIECLIKRNGGSVVELPIKDSTATKSYHFAPNAAGAHVADVADKDHIRCLLTIDVYQIYDEADADGDVVLVEPAGTAMPPASGDDAPGSTEADDAPVAGDDDEDPEAPLGEDDLGPMTLVDEPITETAPLVDLDESALRAVFAEKLGRKPHPSMTRESMIAKLEEAAAA